jgi:hypothetical protein
MLMLTRCPSPNSGNADSAGLGRDAFGTYQTLPDGQLTLCAQPEIGSPRGGAICGDLRCGDVRDVRRHGVRRDAGVLFHDGPLFRSRLVSWRLPAADG